MGGLVSKVLEIILQTITTQFRNVIFTNIPIFVALVGALFTQAAVYHYPSSELARLVSRFGVRGAFSTFFYPFVAYWVVLALLYEKLYIGVPPKVAADAE
jgi:hypothetical protein